MAARLARSLESLRAQVNDCYPGRSKKSDGWIGDPAHAARTSDHNPNKAGVVTALDITHDPSGGLDAGKLAEILRASGDPRIKYIISNRRIANSGKPWRKYTGSNPHTMHVHVSVVTSAKLYDDASDWDWQINGGEAAPEAKAPPLPAAAHKPVLQQGSKGEAVKELQTLLKMSAKDIDGDFGPKTRAAVIAFQKKKKITADAIVGPYTWGSLT